MGVIIDLIIVAILAICIFLGYHKGLTGSLLKIVSFAVAIIIAFVLYKPIAGLIIDNTDWDENLEQSIRNMVVEQEKAPQTEEEEKKGMSDVITNYINEAVENAADDAKEAIIDSTARDVAVTIVNVGTWIALFIIAKIALILVRGLAKMLTSLPIIKQVDKLGGIAYGLLEALIILYVLLAVISFISPMMERSALIEGIQSSFIGSQLYNNNLLLKIVF